MNLWRPIKRFLPRGLFWRSLIIIVAPILLLLGILSYVFFERNLETSTRALATDVAADVTFLVALEDTTPEADRARVRRLAAQQLRYRIVFRPGARVTPPTLPPRSTIDRALDEVIAQQIGPRRHFNTGRDDARGAKSGWAGQRRGRGSRSASRRIERHRLTRYAGPECWSETVRQPKRWSSADLARFSALEASPEYDRTIRIADFDPGRPACNEL